MIKSYLLADSHCTVTNGKAPSVTKLNVCGFNYVRRVKAQTAESVASKPSVNEFDVVLTVHRR
jgi:hypothetical protein